jgi:uncharacterized protein YkwD
MLRSWNRTPLAAACALALALTASPAFADGQDASTAAAACVDIAGIVQLGCPAEQAPAKPKPKAKKAECAGEDARPTSGTVTRMNRATLCLLNRERTKHGLVPFTSRPLLSGAARRFALELVRKQFFDHTAPDGTTMLDRIKATGYLSGSLHQWWVGENIAYGTGDLATPKAIVRAWMNSPGHRENILDSHFREIGLGLSLGSPDGPDGATYVNDFGRRIP